jgi:hypothetical protein
MSRLLVLLALLLVPGLALAQPARPDIKADDVDITGQLLYGTSADGDLCITWRTNPNELMCWDESDLNWTLVRRLHIRDTAKSQLRADFDSNSYLDVFVPNAPIDGDNDTPLMQAVQNGVRRFALFPSGQSVWTISNDGVTEVGSIGYSTPNSGVGIVFAQTPFEFRSDFGHNDRGGFVWTARTDEQNIATGWQMFFEPIEAGVTPDMGLAIGYADTENHATAALVRRLQIQDTEAGRPQFRLASSSPTVNFTDFFQDVADFKVRIGGNGTFWLERSADTTDRAEFNVQSTGALDMRTALNRWFFSNNNGTGFTQIDLSTAGKMTFDSNGSSGTQEFEFLDPVRITSTSGPQLTVREDSSNGTTFESEADGDLVVTPAGTSTVDGVGIGTSPAAKLHVLSTTEQLRVGYDASNYFNATVDSGGIVYFSGPGAPPSIDFNFAGTLSVNRFGGATLGLSDETAGTAGVLNHTSGLLTVTSNDINLNSTGNGVGVDTPNPLAKLHITETTEQLRLGYDSTNYTSSTVSSAGKLTLDSVSAAGDAEFEFSDEVLVPDDAYNATTWNGNVEVPTKNAVRDQLEVVLPYSRATSLPSVPTATQMFVLNRQAGSTPNRGDIVYISAQQDNAAWAWVQIVKAP